MSGIAIRATLDGVDLAIGALRDMAARGADLTPLMRRVGAVLVRSVDTNFEAGGRPQKWRERSPSTVAAMVGEFQRRAQATQRFRGARREGTREAILERAATVARGHGVLVVSGALRKSIVMEATATSVRVGTADKRGPLLQFGGVIRVPELTPKAAKALRFYVPGGGAVFARRTRAHDATIPARPFLLVQDEDGDAIRALTVAHLVGAQGDGGDGG